MVKLVDRLSRPNAEIAFADSGGDGAVVVLIHGAGLDHSMFDSQATALAQRGFRVIVWDLRGHGQSTLANGARFAASDALDDLDALLAECDVAKPVLVGHSLGGNLAQAFACSASERVKGVIVVDSTWNAGPLSRFERIALQLAAPGLSLIPAGRLPRLMALASAVTPEAIARTEAIFARMPKARFLDVWRATVSFVDPAPGRLFPVPLALVRGAEDATGNISTAMPRWAKAEGVQEYVIPKAGHIVTWDAPEQVSSTLIEILDGWNHSLAGQEEPS